MKLAKTSSNIPIEAWVSLYGLDGVAILDRLKKMPFCVFT